MGGGEIGCDRGVCVGYGYVMRETHHMIIRDDKRSVRGISPV